VSGTNERYQEAALLTEFSAGTPHDALDTARTVNLAATDT
jgi:hypothetical protein